MMSIYCSLGSTTASYKYLDRCIDAYIPVSAAPTKSIKITVNKFAINAHNITRPSHLRRAIFGPSKWLGCWFHLMRHGHGGQFTLCQFLKQRALTEK